jgi:hypothetical protein
MGAPLHGWGRVSSRSLDSHSETAGSSLVGFCLDVDLEHCFDPRLEGLVTALSGQGHEGLGLRGQEDGGYEYYAGI